MSGTAQTPKDFACELAAEAADRVEEMRQQGVEPTLRHLVAAAAYKQGAMNAGATEDEIRAARRTS